jgi:hypothetical protein
LLINAIHAFDYILIIMAITNKKWLCSALGRLAPIAPNFLADGINGGKVDPFSISGAYHWYTAETMCAQDVLKALES